MLDPSIVPIHLDVVSSHAQMDYFIELVNQSDPYVSIVVSTLPQTLTNKFPKFVNSLVLDRIWFVVVDELHMFNLFLGGASEVSSPNFGPSF